jgi:hypothetical protein
MREKRERHRLHPYISAKKVAAEVKAPMNCTYSMTDYAIL